MRVTYRDPVKILEGYEEIQKDVMDGCNIFVYYKDDKYFHISVPLLNGELQGNAKMVCVGRVVADLSYRRNQLNGECILYHENGKMMEKVQVVNGWKKGRYTLFGIDGKVIERGYYTNEVTGFEVVSSSDDDNENQNIRRPPVLHDDVYKNVTTAALIASGLVIIGKMIIRSRL